MYYVFFLSLTALIVQWLGHLVVAEKTWVRFPLGAHNTSHDDIVRRFFSIPAKFGLRSHRFFLLVSMGLCLASMGNC